jgi:hypothetical protein
VMNDGSNPTARRQIGKRRTTETSSDGTPSPAKVFIEWLKYKAAFC